jgi:hypothetical protein
MPTVGARHVVPLRVKPATRKGIDCLCSDLPQICKKFELIAVVIYKVPVVMVHAGRFLQGVSALQAMNQMALDDPRSREHLWILN